MAKAKQKVYVQFSKKMVVFVSAAVTVVCASGVVLCGFALGSADGVVEIVRAYIGYASVCFAAYSGNSAVEKWLIYTARKQAEEDEEETSSNG